MAATRKEIVINIGENYLEELGKRLEKYGISRRQLARTAGYEDSDITRMFNQGVEPRLDKIRRLELAIVKIRRGEGWKPTPKEELDE